MNIAGIDFSTHAVDVVYLSLDDNAAMFDRFTLEGSDAFTRARAVVDGLPAPKSQWWDDTLMFAIEEPKGHHTSITVLYRVQGAILACLPSDKAVMQLEPWRWRQLCGLKGTAGKNEVADWARGTWENAPEEPSQDTLDAFCIAFAARELCERETWDAA